MINVDDAIKIIDKECPIITNRDDIVCHRCQECGNLVSANKSKMVKTDADKYLNGQEIIPDLFGQKWILNCNKCIQQTENDKNV